MIATLFRSAVAFTKNFGFFLLFVPQMLEKRAVYLEVAKITSASARKAAKARLGIDGYAKVQTAR